MEERIAGREREINVLKDFFKRFKKIKFTFTKFLQLKKGRYILQIFGLRGTFKSGKKCLSKCVYK